MQDYSQTYPHAHPASLALLRFFEYNHLPPHLQNISKPFYGLAHQLIGGIDGPELTAALRKLLEAKDCAVRAALPGAPHYSELQPGAS